MPTPVKIRLLTDDPSPARLDGVVVDFYDTGAVFQTSGTTDVNGEVQVSLPDADYDLMFFKVGVTVLPKQPQRITVDSLLPNIFEVTAHVRTLPEVIDTTMCTVSGTIKGVGGNKAIHRLIFEPVLDLIVQGGQIVAPFHRVEFTSDENGYFQFQLLRNTKYLAYYVFPQDLFKRQPGKLNVQTPNGPTVDIRDFLYPIPINMTFSATTISLVAGSGPDESIDADLTFTDGVIRAVYGTDWAGISLTIDDNTIVTPLLTDAGTLRLIPMKAGTATITTVREIPTTVFFDPLPAYVSNTVVVTVT